MTSQFDKNACRQIRIAVIEIISVEQKNINRSKLPRLANRSSRLREKTTGTKKSDKNQILIFYDEKLCQSDNQYKLLVDEFTQLKKGAIRRHMYQIKNTIDAR